jgi:hypothetical protein
MEYPPSPLSLRRGDPCSQSRIDDGAWGSPRHQVLLRLALPGGPKRGARAESNPVSASARVPPTCSPALCFPVSLLLLRFHNLLGQGHGGRCSELAAEDGDCRCAGLQVRKYVLQCLPSLCLLTIEVMVCSVLSIRCLICPLMLCQLSIRITWFGPVMLCEQSIWIPISRACWG